MDSIFRLSSFSKSTNNNNNNSSRGTNNSNNNNNNIPTTNNYSNENDISLATPPKGIMPRKSSLKTPRSSLLPYQENIYTTNNSGSNNNNNNNMNINTPKIRVSTSTTLPNFLTDTPNGGITPTPIKNRVMMSEIKPTVHRYPTSPIPNKSNSNNHNNNNNNNIDDEMMDVCNESFMSSASSKFYRNYNNDQYQQQEPFNGTPESIYYNGGSSSNTSSKQTSTTTTGGAPKRRLSTSSGPPKLKKVPFMRKVKDMIMMPIHKFDELHERVAIFQHTSNPLYKTVVFSIAALFNLLLLAYSMDLMYNVVGFSLLAISIINTILFLHSSKKVYLYRYNSNQFKSQNMYIEQVQSPTGSIDNIVVLKVWDPKYINKVLFTLFSPLHVILMMMAGPDFERFVVFSSLSVLFSYVLYFFNNKYDEKLEDEKLLFGQICEEYNHFMKVKIPMKTKSM